MHARMKILLLDDNSDLRDAIEWTLRWEGHEVVSLARGQDALEYLAGHTVDFVLMDWNMPALSGAEFLRRAKAHFLPLFTPRVAVMSGDLEARFDAHQGGADYFLEKPMGPEGLVRALSPAA